MSARRPLLVTGATGYVGGRLLPALLARGEHVRCLARRPEAIASRPGLEVVAGDALDAAAVRRALEGVDVAYYLIHAMGTAEAFQERDRQAATLQNLGRGTLRYGVRRPRSASAGTPPSACR